MLDAAPESFPINIDFIFKNQISSERIGSLCWTKFDQEAGLVSVSGCKSNPNRPAPERVYLLTFCAF